ncbi:MAG: hypothetical protein OEZ65_01995 [Gemmatimonadota bacterium]|nr:hypothetical protein [Gemmatimonadota bacterium]MDH5758331.1 hypothetical protein [Gemmatimonadota bacterium]
MTRFRTALFLAAAVLAPPRTPVEGQGWVRSVGMEVSLLSGTGDAVVEMTYDFGGVAAGDPVPFRILAFAGAQVDTVEFGWRDGGAARSVPLVPVRGALDTLTIPWDVGPEGIPLRVRYHVADAVEAEGAGMLRIHLPVLAPAWPPQEAEPGLFRARVPVPPEWVVTESFPTSLSGGGGEPSITLAVVPSVVTLRVRIGDARGVTLPLILDAAALAVLLVFAGLGWRHLRVTG